MTTSSTGEHTPLVTEIKETEAFGYHISLSNDSLYVSPKKPIDDGDEVVAAFCETWKADRERIQSLEAALKPIIDCYGVGYKATELEEFVTAIGGFIEEARAALGQKGDV